MKNDYVSKKPTVKLMVSIIKQMEASVKTIEKHLSELTENDEIVEYLLTIREYSNITAWIIRAYTEDVSNFSNTRNTQSLQSSNTN